MTGPEHCCPAEELAIGRLYDLSGENELTSLEDFGRQSLGALNIEFRAAGGLTGPPGQLPGFRLR